MKHVTVNARRAIVLTTRKHEQTGYSYDAAQVRYEDGTIAWVPEFLCKDVGLVERVKERMKAR